MLRRSMPGLIRQHLWWMPPSLVRGLTLIVLVVETPSIHGGADSVGSVLKSVRPALRIYALVTDAGPDLLSMVFDLR
jgi:hypothetical protein